MNELNITQIIYEKDRILVYTYDGLEIVPYDADEDTLALLEKVSRKWAYMRLWNEIYGDVLIPASEKDEIFAEAFGEDTLHLSV